METKVCKKCNAEKSIEQFTKNGKYYKSSCKECNNKINRERQRGNKAYAERAKKYREANKERIKQKDREYNRSIGGRESNYRRNMKRRTKKYEVHYEEHKFWDLLEKDNWTCQRCGKWVHDVWKPLGDMTKDEYSHKASADHVIPMHVGGATVFNNMQILCMPCNSSKHREVPADELLS